MAQKFIINSGKIIMGDVEYHADLLAKEEHRLTVGGGYFYFHTRHAVLFFYGSSSEFGYCTQEKFDEAIKNFEMPVKYKGYKTFFSDWDLLNRAIIDYEKTLTEKQNELCN